MFENNVHHAIKNDQSHKERRKTIQTHPRSTSLEWSHMDFKITMFMMLEKIKNVIKNFVK